MASIWTQGVRTPLQKLEGHLPPHPMLARQRLVDWAERLALKNKAKIITPANGREEFEMWLQWPDGQLFSVFIEFLSPPSAAETGQPKRKVKQ